MKEEILELLETIAAGDYDREIIHQNYDALLERFIRDEHYNDDELIPLVNALIATHKEFWYA